jgi:hypothetical protein
LCPSCWPPYRQKRKLAGPTTPAVSEGDSLTQRCDHDQDLLGLRMKTIVNVLAMRLPGKTA